MRTRASSTVRVAAMVIVASGIFVLILWGLGVFEPNWSAAAEKIENGMSYEEVVCILGGEGELHSREGDHSEYYWRRGSMRTRPLSIWVEFEDDRVVDVVCLDLSG